VKLSGRDLIHALSAAGAPSVSILAYQLQEESYFDGSAPPLSLTTGRFTTGTMVSPMTWLTQQPSAGLDENLVYYVDNVRPAILAAEPTALVTIGFFWPQGPNPARPRHT